MTSCSYKRVMVETLIDQPKNISKLSSPVIAALRILWFSWYMAKWLAVYNPKTVN